VNTHLVCNLKDLGVKLLVVNVVEVNLLLFALFPLLDCVVLRLSSDDVWDDLVAGPVVAYVVLQIVILLLLRVGSEELLVHLEIILIDLLLALLFLFFIFLAVVLRVVLLLLNLWLILQSLHELLL